MSTTHEIRRTGVRLTRLGLGGAGIGNLYRAVDDDTARATVDTAWDHGLRYFDTAPHYGLGLSERRLGAALRDRPRADFVVSSKVGRRLVPRVPPAARDDEGFVVPGRLTRRRDYTRDGVLRQLEGTLERTGLDRIDVVYVHDPDEHWPQAVGGAVPALVDLRDQGVIGAVGVGMNQSSMPARFLRETDVDVVMVAGRYTLLEQGALDDLLPVALDAGRAVVAAGVFNSGLLARHRVPDDAPFDYAQAPAHLIGRARELARVCAEHGTTLPAASVAYPLRHPAVVNVTLGASDADQVARNAGLLGTTVPEELWEDLGGRGLLRRPADAVRRHLRRPGA